MSIWLLFGTTTAPGVNEKIKLEVKPPEGAVLSIGKTMPAALVTDNIIRFTEVNYNVEHICER